MFFLESDPNPAAVQAWQISGMIVAKTVAKPEDVPHGSDVAVSSVRAIPGSAIASLLSRDCRLVFVEDGIDGRRCAGLGDIQHDVVRRLAPALAASAPATPGFDPATMQAEIERLNRELIECRTDLAVAKGGLNAAELGRLAAVLGANEDESNLDAAERVTAELAAANAMLAEISRITEVSCDELPAAIADLMQAATQPFQEGHAAPSTGCAAEVPARADTPPVPGSDPENLPPGEGAKISNSPDSAPESGTPSGETSPAPRRRRRNSTTPTP